MASRDPSKTVLFVGGISDKTKKQDIIDLMNGLPLTDDDVEIKKNYKGGFSALVAVPTNKVDKALKYDGQHLIDKKIKVQVDQRHNWPNETKPEPKPAMAAPAPKSSTVEKVLDGVAAAAIGAAKFSSATSASSSAEQTAANRAIPPKDDHAPKGVKPIAVRIETPYGPGFDGNFRVTAHFSKDQEPAAKTSFRIISDQEIMVKQLSLDAPTWVVPTKCFESNEFGFADFAFKLCNTQLPQAEVKLVIEQTGQTKPFLLVR